AFGALPQAQKAAAASFSLNDQWLALASDDHIVRLWRLAWPDQDKTVSLPTSKGTLLSVSPDGKRGLLAQKKAIAIWDIDKSRVVGSIPFMGSAVQTRWAPDGASVAI